MSVATASSSAKESTKTYISTVAARLISMNLAPKCLQAKANSGMFMTMLTTPTGQCVR